MKELNAGDRVVKVGDGRAVPIGSEGTVQFLANEFVYISWDNGDKCAVRIEGVRLLSDGPPDSEPEPEMEPEALKEARALEGEWAREEAKDQRKISLMLAGFLLLLGWLVLVYWTPPLGAPKTLPADFFSRLASVSAALETNVPLSRTRLEPHARDNLVVYLSLHDFQSVEYPDREEFVGLVGASWCKGVGDSIFFLPTVEFRDIRTGKRLAKYSCVLERSRLDSRD